MLVSIVLPVYKSKPYINEMFSRIKSLNMQGNDFEIIFVDDGCPMSSWEVIQSLADNDKRVKGLKLSKNFGQQYAISAGLEYSKGEYVVVMDCDLQEDPNDIPQLLNKLLNENYDIVLTLRSKRAHGFVKNLQAKFFYQFMRFLGAQNEFAERVGTFSCLKRKVVNEFLKYKDVHRHYLMIVRTLGFRICYEEISHSKREAGKTSYSFLKLIRHSIDGIVFQTNRLLKLSILVGIGFLTVSAIMSLRLVIYFFIYGSVAGYTSLMISILLCTGVILFTLGVHGIYIGKIFDQTRGRPLYIVSEQINGDKK